MYKLGETVTVDSPLFLLLHAEYKEAITYVRRYHPINAKVQKYTCCSKLYVNIDLSWTRGVYKIKCIIYSKYGLPLYILSDKKNNMLLVAQYGITRAKTYECRRNKK